MQMCAAISDLGHEVELLTKGADQGLDAGTDVHGFYGVRPSFPVVSRPRPRFPGGGTAYALALAQSLNGRKKAIDLAYSRDPVGVWLAPRLGVPTVAEVHAMPKPGWQASWFRSMLRQDNLVRVVAITEALRRDLEDGFGQLGDRILVAPDAVRDDFCPDFGAQRRERAAGAGTPRVGYVGNLYSGRGIELIAELASSMPDVAFHVVGGSDQAVARFRARYPRPNLTFAGFVPPAHLAREFAKLDVLLMPHQYRVGTGKERSDIARWTSPMKMFEYMATGLPIVASDLPVLGEVLRHGDNALLVPPDAAAAWQDTIRRVLTDRDLATRLGATARSEVLANYTWHRRAERVLHGLV